MVNDYFSAISTLKTDTESFSYYALSALDHPGMTNISRLPFSIRVLLESVLRRCDGHMVTEKDVRCLAAWTPETARGGIEIPFMPARVILQDFTGVPCVVDLAAMRSAVKRLGGDPNKINPLIPVDLVIDHSIQTDFYGTSQSLEENISLEFERNQERYSLLKWAQESLHNFKAVPPSVGIIHQVNLEFLARVVMTDKFEDGTMIAYPDTVVGTDSHTVMINGLGILGWGVGGIEAEAVMLGQPYYMLAPEVIGFELTGQLHEGVTATDLVLTITEILRKEGVVGKFVEYFGEGASSMPVADRAVIANMGPEYGATMGFFPVDAKTIDFLNKTGRSPEKTALIESYCRIQGLYREADSPIPNYSKVLKLDLGSVQPSLAGPKRPQDRIILRDMGEKFRQSLIAPVKERGFGLSESNLNTKVEIEIKRPGSDIAEKAELSSGSVVIASITSCTNTSNPNLMITAGLLARNAVKRGMKTKPFVKTSLGPGSRVVTDYLTKAGLLTYLEELGFNVVGYGCLTCIGNSGPLPEPVAEAVSKNDLVAAAVLSGNRNFEGRVNPFVKANYLASPPLVVAYALAGTVDIDLTTEPLGIDSHGKPVMLSDIWPSNKEVDETVVSSVLPEMYIDRYADVYTSNPRWNSESTISSELYTWSLDSTYIQEPPFLSEMKKNPAPIPSIVGARALLVLGDSVTTDHISPAGTIKSDSPAGKYLIEHGVQPAQFNSYGSRRGNDRVMTRGTFANIRIRNQMVPGTEGGWTKFLGKEDFDGSIETVYDAAIKYAEESVPLIVLAGSEYGTGSSRDWAAKGTSLLGVRAVIAQSFERIHRGNLVGMGVLPLEFLTGESYRSLRLTGFEKFDIDPLPNDFEPRSNICVTATNANGIVTKFFVRVRIDTPVEIEYYRNGGILQTVLRKLVSK
ncbi:MAG: aconitate hydratase AcnA [Thermoguttaceae bacterium]|nr:aconitate hydratase AcnA [Thermoguttaceae bacterium]